MNLKRIKNVKTEIAIIDLFVKEMEGNAVLVEEEIPVEEIKKAVIKRLSKGKFRTEAQLQQEIKQNSFTNNLADYVKKNSWIQVKTKKVPKNRSNCNNKPYETHPIFWSIDIGEYLSKHDELIHEWTLMLLKRKKNVECDLIWEMSDVYCDKYPERI